MISVVTADDHALVQEGIGRIIENQTDMKLVGSATHGDDLLRILDSTRADVLTLDISMPGPGFLPLMRTLGERHPHLAILVVSMHAEEAWALRALKAGAKGYLPKSHSAEELSEAIRRVHRGQTYVTPSMVDLLAGRVTGSAEGEPHETLTPREYDVFLALGSGMMLKTVARELGLSPKTVSTHRRRILDKLGLRSTAEIVRYAVEHGLV
jgi:DNA-binding NarL/FixJ family response regulator